MVYALVCELDYFHLSGKLSTRISRALIYLSCTNVLIAEPKVQVDWNLLNNAVAYIMKLYVNLSK